MANCPKELGDNRNPQSNSRGRSTTPSSTRDRGRGRGSQSEHKGRGVTVSKTVDHHMTSVLARAYAMKAREDQEAPKVTAGIFSLYGIEMHALIDPGFTHSYVCIDHVFDKVTTVEL